MTMPVKRPRTTNEKAFLACVVIVVVTPTLGAILSVIFTALAFRANASVDPSEKARVLAEHIATAMNGAFFGILISLLALVPTVVFWLRIRNERRGGR
ncbi:MAG TPA: hypothetical protein VF407_21710 [Polyangiaceae bacterium]